MVVGVRLLGRKGQQAWLLGGAINTNKKTARQIDILDDIMQKGKFYHKIPEANMILKRF
jgi:hypothetical protein